MITFKGKNLGPLVRRHTDDRPCVRPSTTGTLSTQPLPLQVKDSCDNVFSPSPDPRSVSLTLSFRGGWVVTNLIITILYGVDCLVYLWDTDFTLCGLYLSLRVSFLFSISPWGYNGRRYSRRKDMNLFMIKNFCGSFVDVDPQRVDWTHLVGRGRLT